MSANIIPSIYGYINPMYREMLQEVEKVDDCLMGAHFVKKRKELYLPHPSDVDTKSAEAKVRYRSYIRKAEFPEFAKATMRAELGKLKVNETDIEMDERLKYLRNDCDGTGLSIYGLIRNICRNVIAYNYHICVVDYKGLSTAPNADVLPSKEQIKKENPRATIKTYDRKALVDWDFATVNGKSQINYLMLQEESYEVDPQNPQIHRTPTVSYLRLALDDDGYYYQQKIVKNDSGMGGYELGEPYYLKKQDGRYFKSIPAFIASSSEIGGDELPIDLGWIEPICDAALFAYNVSAKYKSHLDKLDPTMFIGISDAAYELWEKMNGTTNIKMGGVNFVPYVGDNGAEMSVELKGADDTLDGYRQYLKENKEQVIDYGGVVPNGKTVTRTATEVIESAERDAARFTPLADSVEEAVRKCIYWCGVFENIYQESEMDTMIDNVVVSMPRTFATQKLTAEERKTYLLEYQAGTLPIETLHEAYLKGGVIDKSWTKEQLLASLNLD